jgi:TfoX/Sxy family transcriptional regulator of competence genes
MPPFEKSPPELIARFDAVAARFPEAERRKMFGYPALFVGGNLVTGLFADRWMIRLGPDDLETMLEMPGGGPFEPMAGKPMKGYAKLPETVVDDDGAIDDWVGRSIAFGETLPAK